MTLHLFILVMSWKRKMARIFLCSTTSILIYFEHVHQYLSKKHIQNFSYTLVHHLNQKQKEN